MKIIDAICVTSQEQKRMQIAFDEKTGLITEVGDLNHQRVDYYYNDNCLLFGGMGDVHIHAREDVSQKNVYKEDFLTARDAMINGGVTHAGDMPNNPIPPIDDKSYEAKLRLAEKAKGSIWTYAGIGPETRPLSYSVPYKVYMGPSVGELYFKDLESLEKVLVHYQGQHVSFHCEDPEILECSSDKKTHYERRPSSAEVVATRDALRLIEKYSLKGKLCHYSTSEGLNLIREARARGVNVSIEATPQHLYFNQDDLSALDEKKFQMNPPIRPRVDQEVLLNAFVNGEINFLATDHAPHTLEEKEKGTSGLTGLDTYGQFVTWLLHKGISPHLIAKTCVENPGSFFNQFLPSWNKLSSIYQSLGKGVGFLETGYSAHFTVLNLSQSITIERTHLKTKVGHSPFEGVTFPGKIEAVFIGGQKL